MSVKKLAGKVFLLSGIAAGLLGGVAHASGSAYVINGHGVSVCPENSLCLYADNEFNGVKHRTKILVIPSGASAGNFAEYGFDHSADGVSSVYNNTRHKTGLVSGMYLTGQVLELAPGQQIRSLFGFPLGTGIETWNDAPKSAISGPVLKSSLQLELRGPGNVIAGKEIAYTIDVRNGGPNSVKDGRVEIAIPKNLDQVTIECTAKSNAKCGKLSDNKTTQNLILPKEGRAQ